MSRPRGATREQAILGATLDLLVEIGYERLTMDAVAARARASKATIYRRWAGKPELVAQALRQYADAGCLDVPDTGSLRDDLIAVLTAVHTRFRDKDRGLFGGLLHCMQAEPELATIVRAQIAQNKRIVSEIIARRALAHGESSPDVDLVADIAPAQLMTRLMITGEPTGPAYVADLVDRVLLPLLTHHFPDRVEA